MKAMNDEEFEALEADEIVYVCECSQIRHDRSRCQDCGELGTEMSAAQVRLNQTDYTLRVRMRNPTDL